MKFVDHLYEGDGTRAVRPDGAHWPHVLERPGPITVFADTPREILEELIDGYAALSDDDARAAGRERHAVETATSHQERRIAQAVADRLVRLDDPDDAALVGVLRDVRGRAIALASTDATPTETAATSEAPLWAAPIRLVCVATAYAPYGDLPLPRGHVDVLDPSDEGGYLLSLRRAGVLNYWAQDLVP